MGPRATFAVLELTKRQISIYMKLYKKINEKIEAGKVEGIRNAIKRSEGRKSHCFWWQLRSKLKREAAEENGTAGNMFAIDFSKFSRNCFPPHFSTQNNSKNKKKKLNFLLTGQESERNLKIWLFRLMETSGRHCLQKLVFLLFQKNR